MLDAVEYDINDDIDIGDVKIWDQGYSKRRNYKCYIPTSRPRAQMGRTRIPEPLPEPCPAGQGL